MLPTRGTHVKFVPKKETTTLHGYRFFQRNNQWMFHSSCKRQECLVFEFCGQLSSFKQNSNFLLEVEQCYFSRVINNAERLWQYCFTIMPRSKKNYSNTRTK